MFGTKSIVSLFTLGLAAVAPVSATFDWPDACPGLSALVLKNNQCICKDFWTHQVKPFNPGCTATKTTWFGLKFCIPSCTGPSPSGIPRAKRHVTEHDADEGVIDYHGHMHNPKYNPCPKPKTGCPIFPNLQARSALKASDFECVDAENDMDNCGGCQSLDEGESCVDIPFVKGTACVRGRCQVYSCQAGYTPVTVGRGKTKKMRCVPDAEVQK